MWNQAEALLSPGHRSVERNKKPVMEKKNSDRKTGQTRANSHPKELRCCVEVFSLFVSPELDVQDRT